QRRTRSRSSVASASRRVNVTQTTLAAERQPPVSLRGETPHDTRARVLPPYCAAMRHGADAHEPSSAIVRWARLVPRGAAVLDVAAGRGRHAHWFAARGHAVVAVDRDTTSLAAPPHADLQIVQA